MEILQDADIKDITCELVKDEEAKELFEKAQEVIKLCQEKKSLGIAFPQIGINKKVFVAVISGDQYTVCFNPRFYKVGKSISVLEECLSCEGKYIVNRAKEVQAVYYIYDGEKLKKQTKPLRNVQAVLFQHETEHVGNDQNPPRLISQFGEKK